MASIKFRIIIEKGDAKAAVTDVEAQVDDLKQKAEEPKSLKLDAQAALGVIRDVMLNLSSLKSVIDGVVGKANDLLNASLKQRQAVTLTNIAFGEQSESMQEFASRMQAVTNHGDEELLPLMAKMRQTFKMTTDEVQAITPYILDFADANASTGMTVSAAFSLMGRAVNGYTDSLREYGVELDKSRIQQEGVSYLVEKLAGDYGGVSEALVDLRLQNANAWGDIKEQIGDMLNVLIEPLLKGIRDLFDWYNQLTPVVKGFVTGLVVAIPVIGAVTTAITVLTTVVIALKAAINPVVGVISLLAAGATAAGFAFASSSSATRNAGESLERYKRQVEEARQKLDELIAGMTSFSELVSESRKEVDELSYDQAKSEFETITDAIVAARAKYDEAIKSSTTQDEAWQAFEEERELMARRTALRKRLFDDDMRAIEEYHAGKLRIEREQTWEGVRLLRYRIEQAKAAYEEIREVDAANVDDKLTAYQRWQRLEKQLSDAIEEETNQRLEVQRQYSLLGIEDVLERKIAQLAAERDTELKRAESLQAGEETLQNIRAFYANEEKRLREEQTHQQETEDEEKRARKQQHEQEIEAIREEFLSRGDDLALQSYESELAAVDAYYDRKHTKLLQAGISEEQITEQAEAAKQRIREKYQLKAAQGFSGMFGNIAKAAQAFGKKGFAAWKAMAMAQAMVDTYSSAVAAFKSMAGLPVIGPALGAAAAAAAIAAGLANVHTISKQKYQEAAQGGLLTGPSHAGGGILIEAEGDEYITRKQRVRELGAKFFHFLNYAPLEAVRKTLGSVLVPDIPVPATPSFAFSGGVSVPSSSVLSTLIERVDDLIAENKLLRRELRDKELSVHNHISANGVLSMADPVIVSEKAEEGTLIRSDL